MTGQLQASDVDLAEGYALSFSTSTEIDGLTLNGDGSYSFNASSYQSLGAGETETLEVPVVVTDDQGGTAETTLTITITGTNDNPVAEAHEVLAEEGGLVTGQLQASDVDLAEGYALSFSTSSEVEGLTLYEDGSYSFDASFYQSLSAGETETIEVPVAVADDQGATVETTLTITVTGTNDAPVAEAQQTAVEEGAFVKGQLKAGDIDLAEGAALNFSTLSEVDGLTLNEDGSYSFDASSYQSLGAGEVETLEVPVLVTDDQGSTAETTLTITVTGTNDNPVAEAHEVSAEEGGLLTGQLQASDVDLAEGASLSFSTESEIEGLTLNEDGSYSFDASSYQSLGAGETETIEVPVTVTDDQGATDDTTLTITVTGTNDIPVAEAQQTAVEEGAFVKGQLKAGDIDLAEGSVLSFSTSSEVEGLTLYEDGSYSFDASFYQSLSAGETETIEVPVTVIDDQGGSSDTSLTITVTGTNDLPTVVAEEVVVDEGVIIKGQLEADDIDLPIGASLTFSTDANIDGLTLHADGSYSFDASGYEGLDSGETTVIEVPVIVEDDHGGKAETILTINVAGIDSNLDSSGERAGSDPDEDEENRGRGEEDREEQQGRGDGEDRDEHRGRGDREDREEHRGRGDREDREEYRGRGDREDREEHRGRGDRDDREEHRGRGDREEHRGRGDREEHGGRGDREEHGGRGDREDREEHRGRGDREDREEYRGRGDREDREEQRGRGDREDREEHRGRGDREDREEHRGRGDREDREEHRGRGGRDDRDEHRGRGGRDDRDEHRGRGDDDDREHHGGWGHRDNWDEHPRNGEHGERHEHRGHRFREDNEVSQASPTDIQVQGGVVEEGSASGTVVATLSAIDEDSGDQFSYDLIRDDSGHFDIVGDQLVVSHGADIDYEDRSAHQISIRVTDSTGNTFTETIAINVADVQEAMSVAEEDYSNSDDDDDSGLLEDSDDLDHRDELDADSGLSTDSDYEFSEESSELADGRDFDDSQDLEHEVREDEADNPFDGANYFAEGRGEGWTDVVQLNPDADPNADPSNPWEISVDGEQVQYDIADNALSVNPETSSQITFSDGSELTIEGVERIEW
ncbi:hypothetical protein A3197_12980 [Candidatus Thiodiazotropha endoloripes]|nr:hypothetical protein A3197_12980 [Candidatus Thiodiazotropha endoloripes]